MSQSRRVLKFINEFFDNQTRFHEDMISLVKVLENNVMPALPAEFRPVLKYHIDLLKKFKDNPFKKPDLLSQSEEKITHADIATIMNQAAANIMQCKVTINDVGSFTEYFKSLMRFMQQHQSAFKDSFLGTDRTGQPKNFAQEFIKPVQNIARYGMTLKEVKKNGDELLEQMKEAQHKDTAVVEQGILALEAQHQAIEKITKEHNDRIKDQPVTQGMLMWLAIKESLMVMKDELMKSKKDYETVSRKMDAIKEFQAWGDKYIQSGYVSAAVIKHKLNELHANSVFKSDRKNRSKLKNIMKYVSQSEATFEKPANAIADIFSQPQPADYFTDMVIAELRSLINTYTPKLKEYKEARDSVAASRLSQLIFSFEEVISRLEQPSANQANQMIKINEQLSLLARNKNLQEGLFLAPSYNKINSLASIGDEAWREFHKSEHMTNMIFRQPASNKYFAESVRVKFIELKKHYELKEMPLIKQGKTDLAVAMKKTAKAFDAAIKALSVDENEQNGVKDLSFREIQTVLDQLVKARAPLEIQKYTPVWRKAAAMLLEPSVSDLIKGYLRVAEDKKAQEFDASRVLEGPRR